ncbi:ankyrin repeat [Stylonychia lemnae]|uniref:Ankyrin repeat n=1 Tax=Stylonychia lemnae TaxID=5949 RepID=A0A078ALR0_STYLE|nr:ankyrin repeat [Stylonychia lemnae]|eukprot:CDW82347.1 ankyrin repeat [Stylonychia lemnae]
MNTAISEDTSTQAYYQYASRSRSKDISQSDQSYVNQLGQSNNFEQYMSGSSSGGNILEYGNNNTKSHFYNIQQQQSILKGNAKSIILSSANTYKLRFLKMKLSAIFNQSIRQARVTSGHFGSIRLDRPQVFQQTRKYLLAVEEANYSRKHVIAQSTLGNNPNGYPGFGSSGSQQMHIPIIHTINNSTTQQFPINQMIEGNLTKDQKLNILKQKKIEKETKINAKLNIYASVRPKTDQKDMDRVKKEYMEQLKRHTKQPNIDHLYTVIPHQNYQNQKAPPQTAGDVPKMELELAKLPAHIVQSQQQQRAKGRKHFSLQQASSTHEDEYMTTVCSTDLLNRYTSSTNQNQTSDQTNNLIYQDSKQSPSSESRLSFARSNHFKSTSIISRVKATDQAYLKQKYLFDAQMDRAYSDSDLEDIPDFNSQSYSVMQTEKENQETLRNIPLKHIIKKDVPALIKEIEGVMSLLQRRIMIDQKDHNGRSLMFFAICQKNYEMCEILMRNGADTMMRDNNGRTILHYACILNCEKNIIEMIINYQKLQRSQTVDPNSIGNRIKGNLGLQRNRSQHQYVRNDPSSKLLKIQSVIEEEQDNNTSMTQSLSNSNKVGSIYQTPNIQGLKLRVQQSTRPDLLDEVNQLKKPNSRQESIFFDHINSQKTQDLKDFSTIPFIDIQDKYGKTAMHYVCKNRNIQLLQLMLQAGANTQIADKKSKVKILNLITISIQRCIDTTRDREIHELLNKQSYKNMEDPKQSKTSISNIKKQNTTQNTSISNNILDSGSKQKMQIYIFINLFQRQKNLELSSIEALASLSNTQLCQFIYGIYADNALTYMIRVEDRQKFQYLLSRGIMPSFQDLDGNNALHYAIRMERIEFISYLLEGEYTSYESLGDPYFNQDLSKLHVTLNNLTVNKSYMMNTYSQMNQSAVQVGEQLNSTLRNNTSYQLDALLCIDKSNMVDGFTPFHEAAKQGNVMIFEYLTNIVKKRNEIIQSQLLAMKNKKLNDTITQQLKTCKSLRDIFDFTDNQNMTPLLIAAKNNNLEIVKFLVKEGANLYVYCSQLQNCLHYAVINQNSEMIKYLLFSDVEGQILRNECNYRNQKPENMDTQKKYVNLFQNIWDCAATKTHTAFEKLQYLLRNCSDNQNSESRTLYGMNTPLHFAVIFNNPKALRLLVQNIENGKSLDFVNTEGKTPKDMINMYKSEEDKQRLLLIINRDFALTQPLSPALRKKKFGTHQSSNAKPQSEVSNHLGTYLVNEIDKNKMQRLLVNNSLHNNTNSYDDLPDIPIVETDSPLIHQTLKTRRETQTIITQDQSRVFSRNSDNHILNYGKSQQNNASDHELLSKDTIDYQLKNRQETVVPSQQDQIEIDLNNQREVELFLLRKKQEYVDEKRLGRFNPDLYSRMIFPNLEFKNKLGSPSVTSQGQSLNGSFINGITLNARRQQLEKLEENVEGSINVINVGSY